MTTADGISRLTREHDLRFLPGPGGGSNRVAVDTSRRYQSLTAGFGVAITDTAAYLIHDRLPARVSARLMRLLFSVRDGTGLSYLRVPMGGSDYIVHAPYTYGDLPAGERDATLAHFSLAHDRAYMLPVFRQPLTLNHAITIMANPWSPPAWMKTDDSLIPTSPTGSALRADAYAPLARYLVRVVRGYRAAGVPVQQVGVQNEPLNPLLSPAIPGMLLPAASEARLVRGYVAPAFRHAGIRSRLMIWDFTYPRSLILLPGAVSYVDDVMRTAAPDVGGIADHCYLSDASVASAEHRLFPREPIFETDCSRYLSDIDPAQMAIRALRNWAQGVQLWNAAVDQAFGPKVGNGWQGVLGPHLGAQCIAPVIVDTRTHRYRLTSDYWALAQFSKFIRLGARRVSSTTPSSCVDGVEPLAPCGVEDVAFVSPDDTRVLVATSHAGKPQRLMITEDGNQISFTLPDAATATFVWHDSARSRAARVRAPTAARST